MITIRAGELRHRITIEKPDDAASGWNKTRAWSTYATVWAGIKPIGGSESTDEDTKKDQAEVTHLITMRYIRGLRPSMRATFEGRIFKFRIVHNVDEANRVIEIRAYEETD